VINYPTTAADPKQSVALQRLTSKLHETIRRKDDFGDWRGSPQPFERQSTDMAKIVVYGNCLVYLWASFALGRGLFEVLGDEFWRLEMSELRTPYILLLGGAIVFTVICGAGLLVRREWGRKMSLPWNISLGILFGIVPMASIFLVAGLETWGAIFDTKYLLGMLVGVFLLLFAFGLHSAPVRNYFSQEDQ